MAKRKKGGLAEPEAATTKATAEGGTAEGAPKAELQASDSENVENQEFGKPLTAEQQELADDEKRLRSLQEKISGKRGVGGYTNSDLVAELRLRKSIMLRKLRYQPPPAATREPPPEFDLWRNDCLIGLGDHSGRLYVRLEGGLYREASSAELRYCKTRVSGVDAMLTASLATRSLGPNGKPEPPKPVPRDPVSGKIISDKAAAALKGESAGNA